MYAIENPNIDTNRFQFYPMSPQLNAVAANETLSRLRNPLQVFAPVRAAQDILEIIFESMTYFEEKQLNHIT